MKKGVVMEITKRHMIVLTKDGQFVRAKPKAEVGIGEEVAYSPVPIYQFWSIFERKLYSVPLAFVLALLLIFPISSLFPTSTVYGVVSLDMNPSIELAVNDHYEIISMIGYNEKGESLLKSIEKPLEGMPLLNGASELLKHGYKQGMIHKSNIIYLSSALSFDDVVNFESWSRSISDEYNFDIYSIFVEDGLVKEAQELSISPAKLLLLSNNEIENFDPKEISNTPVQEIEEVLGETFDEIKDEKKLLNDTSEEDANKDNSSNPVGKQTHPHKQDHPGKAKSYNKEKNQSTKKDEKQEKHEEDEKQSDQNKNNQDNKPLVNEKKGNSNANGMSKVKGKQEHKGEGKSGSKQNGR